MTGVKSAFSEFDSGIRRTVKFDDDSVVEIEGHDTILFVDKGGKHHKLTGIYFIPRVKANLVSLGQLDEVGCHISIERGLLKICDDRRWLLTQVRSTENYLYILELEIEQLVSLSARIEEVSWRWHARYRHLNFPALQKLHKEEMVHSLPAIKGVNRQCDGCLIGKQRCTPFHLRHPTVSFDLDDVAVAKFYRPANPQVKLRERRLGPNHMVYRPRVEDPLSMLLLLAYFTNLSEHSRLIIPRLKANLVSLGQLNETDCHISIERGLLKIRDDRRQLLTQVRCTVNCLYILKLEIDQSLSLSARTEEVSWRWQARYGHLNFPALQKLHKEEMVHGLPAIKGVNRPCEGCLIDKQRHTPFPSQASYHVGEPLELVHDDICGPIKSAAPGGKTLFLLLVDDKSCFMWLILLQTKSEETEVIKRIQAQAEAECRKNMQLLHTDRGGEFTSASFGKYYDKLGIQQHLTVPYFPQQNGVVERQNETIVGTARSLLMRAEMPGRF